MRSSKYIIKFVHKNLCKPEHKLNIERINRDLLLQTRSKMENQKIEKIEYNPIIKTWEIEVFNVDARCIQGFIKIPFMENKKYKRNFTGELMDYMLIEFIHAHAPMSNKRKHTWGSTHYNNLDDNDINKIDKVIRKIYTEVRKMQLNKLL